MIARPNPLTAMSVQLTDKRSLSPSRQGLLPFDQPEITQSLSAWLNTPIDAFSFWLDHKSGVRRESSKGVYKAIFGKLCAWLKGRGQSFYEMSWEDLKIFLDQSALTKHHRYRYVRLVERLFDYLKRLDTGVAMNPGRVAAIKKVGSGQDDPSHFLGLEDRAEVLRVLQARMERRESLAQKGKEPEWLIARDVAIAAAMMGGGLKLGQVKALSVNCIDIAQGRIFFKESRTASGSTVLLPWARDLLATWLEIRPQIPGVVSPLAFPAWRRKAGFQRKQGSPASVGMHPSSIHRAVNSLLVYAGIAGERACPQTLRNSYAAALFDLGESDENIAPRLGHATHYATNRLRQAYEAFRRQTNPEGNDGV